MPPRKKATAAKTPAPDVRTAIMALERLGSKKFGDGLARYGIVTKDKTLGISMAEIQKLAKKFGRDHTLADALWNAGIYEARMLAIFVEEPAAVTPAQMERWARDFDNWAVCDTACFKLFDRTPHAFAKVAQWVKRREEFVKRAGFALLASVALHDKKAGDDAFLRTLSLIEAAADDERNFVKKGVSWALRGIGKRNANLRKAASIVAERLATSADPTARWIGKDALKDLGKRQRRPT